MVIRRGRAGLAPRTHLAGRVGAHRLLGRLPVGPRRRAAGSATAAQPRARANRSLTERSRFVRCCRCLAHNQRYALRWYNLTVERKSTREAGMRVDGRHYRTIWAADDGSGDVEIID